MLASSVATTGVSLYVATQQNPRYDLSQWGASLSSMGLIFLVHGVIHLIELNGILPTGFSPYHDMGYSVCGATFYLCCT
jgi:hypothetical protein